MGPARKRRPFAFVWHGRVPLRARSSPGFNSSDCPLGETLDIQAWVIEHLTQRRERVSGWSTYTVKRDASAVARSLVGVREECNQSRARGCSIRPDLADVLCGPSPDTCVVVLQRGRQFSQDWTDVHPCRRWIPPGSGESTQGERNVFPEPDIGIPESASQRRQRVVS